MSTPVTTLNHINLAASSILKNIDYMDSIGLNGVQQLTIDNVNTYFCIKKLIALKNYNHLIAIVSRDLKGREFQYSISSSISTGYSKLNFIKITNKQTK